MGASKLFRTPNDILFAIEQLFKYGQRSASDGLPNNQTDSKILSLKRKNMSLSKSFKPICSMYSMEYLPTLALKITQM
jgi:hypothetical protein